MRIDVLKPADGFKVIEANISPSLGGIGMVDRYCQVLAGQDEQYRAIVTPTQCLSSLLEDMLKNHTYASGAKLYLACIESDMDVLHPYEACHFLNQQKTV